MSAVFAQKNTTEEIIFNINLLSQLTSTIEALPSNSLFTLFLTPEQKQLLSDFKKVAPDLQIIINQLSTGDQRWLLLFQNSNELRATGGFIGSYAIAEISEGKVTKISIEDIYDADGQFTGYVEAPPGVAQYLSSGKGLRLPDANWDPDTAKSAEQILPFFALGKKQNITGLVFVNLDFAKELLTFFGPIELSDYNTIVTNENIDEVLRSRRDAFFPGSIQKKHMLSQLLTQLQLRISNIEPHQITSLTKLVIRAFSNFDLQFYSNNQTIDTIFTKHNLRQKIVTVPDADYLYIVESNVGINKANAGISREVTLQKSNDTHTITIVFTNSNEKPLTSKLTQLTELTTQKAATSEPTPSHHMAYINYQRILVPTDWKVTAIKYNSTPLETFDETIISVNGTDIKQLSFLVVVPESETIPVTITFENSSDFDSIFIQKQPGTPVTKYILEYNQKQSTHELLKNELLHYP